MKLRLLLPLVALVVSSVAFALPGNSLYQLPSQWLDQNGQKVVLKDLAGAPRLAVMLYTRCTTTCPLVLEDIKGILKEVPSELSKNLRMTVFSFDSEKETPASLKDFYESKELDSRWSLLTGDTNSVSTLAAALGVRYKKVGDEYVHSNIIFLLDKDGVVLAKKEGLKTPRTDFVGQVKNLLKR